MTLGLDELGAKRCPASAMARPLRIDIPNGLTHVTSRGLDHRAIVYGPMGSQGHTYRHASWLLHPV